MDRQTLEVAEWRSEELPGCSLHTRDYRIIERLGGKVRIDALAGRLRVTATSYVGVIRLAEVDVKIVPKLAGSHLNLVRMLQWTTGLDAFEVLPHDHDLDVNGEDLSELLALLFVRAAERVLRAGVRSDYVVREEAVPIVRGRILADRQLIRHGRRTDRVECRFDDRSSAIFDNALLLAAAETCARRASGVDIRRRARRVSLALHDSVGDDEWAQVRLPRQTVRYDRLNAHYRGAHELAWLLLEGFHGFDDLFRAGKTTAFAFLLNMDTLFERFVERLLRTALVADAVSLRFQRPSGSVIRHAGGAAYINQRPDTLLRAQAGGPAVAIDAKYKRYSNRRIDPGDIAQTFLYAQAFGPRPESGCPNALIVYPSETDQVDTLALSLHHEAGDVLAGVTALGVPIPAAIDEATGAGIGPVMQAVRAVALSALHDESLRGPPPVGHNRPTLVPPRARTREA